jgi:D-glycero-D-manno-heptose 1,7-bisphosphate phosphatase
VIAFLDRDGTINVKAPEGEYIERPADVVLLPGAAAAVARLNAAGIPVAVVTNQRGVALGRMTADDVRAIHARLDELLGAEGAHVDRYEFCPHDRGTCRCRKPGTLLLERAAEALGADPADGVMIGDAASDEEAGRAVGARTLRLGQDVADLAEAVDRVLHSSGVGAVQSPRRPFSA